MRFVPSRKTVVTFGVAVAVAAALAIGFDRYVRARVAAEGDRRHVDVVVGAVRPAWIGVRLLDVRATPRGVGAIGVRVDEVRVDVGAGLAITNVRVRGGAVDVTGSREDVTAALREWRAGLPSSTHDASLGARASVAVESIALRWPAENVDATGITVKRDADGGLAIGASYASIGVGAIAVQAEDAHASLDRAYGLRSASAARVVATYDARAFASLTSSEPTTSVASAKSATNDGTASPELRALRSRARRVAASIARALPVDADVSIDALSLVPRGDGVALGPGAFAVKRTEERVVVSFTTLPAAATTPLTARVDLPIDRGDARITLDGGPVPLALLGLRDGVAGLGDLDHANVAGRAELVLAANDERLSFDVDLHAHDVAIEQRRLATAMIHGLELGARARGTFDASGALRIDESDVAVGNAHVLANGTIETSAARAGASLVLSVPRTDCQTLLDSAPADLVPTVHGAHLGGALAARARFSLTLRKPDAIAFDWSVDSTCRVLDVPPHLARERYKRPFSHKRYSPRGEIREETIGPTTAGWTPLGAMSRFLPIAIVMTEDGGIFRRDGFNRAQIDYAIVTDLKERRFARGASTLTMQLAKNLFLSRDKVLARKLEELVLTLYLSQHFSKDEILELYLNIVEFGPDVYGVRAAAAHYFGKGPSNVTLAEALFLASMLPSPLKLHGLKNPNGVPEAYVASFHHLMDLAKQSGLITESDVDAGKAETIVFR